MNNFVTLWLLTIGLDKTRCWAYVEPVGIPNWAWGHEGKAFD